MPTSRRRFQPDDRRTGPKTSQMLILPAVLPKQKVLTSFYRYQDAVYAVPPDFARKDALMGTDNPSLCNGRTRLCVRISPEGKLPQGGSGTTSAVFCAGLAATARSLGQNLSAYYFPSVPFWVSKYRYSIAQPFPFVKGQPGFCTGNGYPVIQVIHHPKLF